MQRMWPSNLGFQENFGTVQVLGLFLQQLRARGDSFAQCFF